MSEESTKPDRLSDNLQLYFTGNRYLVRQARRSRRGYCGGLLQSPVVTLFSTSFPMYLSYLADLSLLDFFVTHYQAKRRSNYTWLYTKAGRAYTLPTRIWKPKGREGYWKQEREGRNSAGAVFQPHHPVDFLRSKEGISTFSLPWGHEYIAQESSCISI